jgi:hypothetical protein
VRLNAAGSERVQVGLRRPSRFARSVMYALAFSLVRPSSSTLKRSLRCLAIDRPDVVVNIGSSTLSHPCLVLEDGVDTDAVPCLRALQHIDSCTHFTELSDDR